MSPFLSILAFFASGTGGEKGGFSAFYDQYLNYPGFELWKFINLALFIAILVYLVKRPLSEAFKAKREAIRAELIRAEQEKQAALAKLAAVEARLAGLENEKAAILKKAEAEAAAERSRVKSHAEAEAAKIREQAEGELSRLAKQVRAQLKRFSAEESVRVAEETVKSQLDAEKDARLVRAGIREG
jgi:F-type H+-transporting ATPase subunit b